jgi:hypothetical protein
LKKKVKLIFIIENTTQSNCKKQNKKWVKMKRFWFGNTVIGIQKLWKLRQNHTNIFLLFCCCSRIRKRQSLVSLQLSIKAWMFMLIVSFNLVNSIWFIQLS